MKNVYRFLAVFCLLIAGGASAFAQTESEDGVIEGTVKSKIGSTVTLVVEGTPQFRIGEEGVMSKYFENTMGKMTMNGWLNVAHVRIVGMGMNGLRFEIIKEVSEITVNDEKVNHFKSGNKMKFVPGIPEEEEK